MCKAASMTKKGDSMDLLQYLLPLLVIGPVVVNGLSRFYPRIALNPLSFFAPIGFLALSLFCFLNHTSVELHLFSVSTYFSLGLKLDVLSGVISATVATIGIVVTRFSIRYLEDDKNNKLFSKNLAFTLSSILFMLMAPSLVLFFLSWVSASYFLHQLLTHFSERKGAIRAATQKFWVSRLGDIFVISSGALLFLTFYTLEFEPLFKMANDSLFIQENYFALNAAAILLVLGAMTKSAQFPFHFWLPNTMETPTPVSAIMHAGIINAGGYIVIRMSPLLSHVPLALSILAIFGGFTAFLGMTIMFTQTSVKKGLAYSTIAQMGFMMLQCGLGAFSVAVVHIIGHAFYKSYAFLSSGTATDFGRLNRYFPKAKTIPSLWAPYILAFISLFLILVLPGYFGHNMFAKPGVSVLLFVLALAAAQIVLNAKEKIKGLGYALTIVFVYIGLAKVMAYLLSGIIPTHVSPDGVLGTSALIICTGFFALLYLMQNNLSFLSETQMGKRLYVRALKGRLW